MCQTVGEGVDLIQEGGQSVDGRAEERKNEGFTRGNIMVELIVGREGVRVVDTQLDEGLFEEVTDVDEVFSRENHRGGPGGGDRRGGEAETLRSIVDGHCSSLGVRREYSSLRVLSGAAH